MTLHMFLYLVACVCFLIAATPHKINLRFEWLAFAALTLTLIV